MPDTGENDKLVLSGPVRACKRTMFRYILLYRRIIGFVYSLHCAIVLSLLFLKVTLTVLMNKMEWLLWNISKH